MRRECCKFSYFYCDICNKILRTTEQNFYEEMLDYCANFNYYIILDMIISLKLRNKTESYEKILRILCTKKN